MIKVSESSGIDDGNTMSDRYESDPSRSEPATSLENATERERKNFSLAELNTSEFAKFHVDIRDEWPSATPSLGGLDERPGITDEGRVIEPVKTPEGANRRLDAKDDIISILRLSTIAMHTADDPPIAAEKASAFDPLKTPDGSKRRLDATDDIINILRLSKIAVHTADDRQIVAETTIAFDPVNKPEGSNKRLAAFDDISNAAVEAIGALERKVPLKKSLIVAPWDASIPLEAVRAAEKGQRRSNGSERGSV